MNLKNLSCLTEDLDDVFEEFYSRMLSNSDFAVFFKNDEQIRSLIGKQKSYFIASLQMSEAQLRDVYIALGEKHYDIKLPFVDFSAAMVMLEESILSISTRKVNSAKVIEAAFKFFRLVRGFTAKGYLNRMLDDDSRDIDLYLENVQRSTEIDTAFTTERILWLKNLIFTIKIENRNAAPPLYLPPQMRDSIRLALSKDANLAKYVSDTVSRIEIDAANVFYFIEKRSYEEVLTLYRELMNIYKLSLMLSNVITIATSNQRIGSLTKDTLTGLLTRSSLDAIVSRELTIATASGYEIALIMVDIDHFKSINDTYGHNAGDKVLRKVATILHEGIRATDFSFRYGGEEFLLLLKGASEKICLIQAENMRQEIERTRFDFDGQEVRVTASFGIATFNRPFIISFEKMFERADEKLYQSKNEGRNRITV